MENQEIINEEKGNDVNHVLANVIVRSKDYDGMGGWEYEYQCCKCKTYVNSDDKFCKKCGERFDSIYKKDGWGFH